VVLIIIDNDIKLVSGFHTIEIYINTIMNGTYLFTAVLTKNTLIICYARGFFKLLSNQTPF
jgi:hypothetical protein